MIEIYIEFECLSGHHQGERRRFISRLHSQNTESPSHIVIKSIINNVITIGRHPSNDCLFEGDQDLRVSSTHAEVRLEGQHFILADLNSTNGTFVNGNRITRYRLKNGDIIEFGRRGPQVRSIIPSDPPDVQKTVFVQTSGNGEKMMRTGDTTLRMMINEAMDDAKQKGGLLRGSPTVFVRHLVARIATKSSRKLRYSLIGVAIALVAGVVVLVSQNMTLQQKLAEASAEQKKSLMDLEQQFAKELENSRQRTKFLQLQIEKGRGEATIGSAEMKELGFLLSSERRKTAKLDKVLNATRDSIVSLGVMTKDMLLSLRSFQQVAKENAESIFMICAVNTQMKEVVPIGTGFVVREDGILMTNAHVASELKHLLETAGAMYVGIAIQNENSTNRYGVDVVTIDPQYDPDADYSPDLAWLKVNAKASRLRPVVVASSAELRKIDKGYEIAVIGFPGLTMSAENPVATFSRGAIGRLINQSYLQHDCQTSGGSSGSPIFNRSGQLVGIHYGGRGNVSVLVPMEVPDSNGGTKQVITSQRIKEAVGLNEGIRADLIAEFLKSVP